MGRNDVIIYGAFKAMGDFLAAAPVIKSELDSGSHVFVLIVPGLEEFVQLIDFGCSAENLRLIRLPVGPIRSMSRFLRQMREISPDVIWISPHAPAPASNWKIPLLLRVVKALYWRRTILAGSETEHMSSLFDIRSSTSRSLPFAEREWESYAVLKRTPDWKHRPTILFRAGIQDETHKEPLYDLLIHPGAGAANRKWPFTQYSALVKRLPRSYRLGIVGLPQDVNEMRKVVPADREIEFITGTLEQSIQTIARCRVLLTMDSGNMFFADMLNVPAIAIFGASDPTNVIEAGRAVLPIYQQTAPCQPCGKKVCIHNEPKCITSISPTYVADQLIRMMESSPRQ